jgi:hypothetical protein
MTTVQAIYYTHRTAEWHAFARDLGLTDAFPPQEAWSEFDGGGILAVHSVSKGSERDGTTELHVLVDDLHAVEASLHETGAVVTRTMMADVGDVVTATLAPAAATSAPIPTAVSASTGGRTARGELSVQPLWSPEDGDQAVRVLEALGLRQRIRSGSGDWVDFEAGEGGLAAFHAGMAEASSLSFEYTGDLGALAEHLRTRGHEASIVDEAYNRTLLVPTPDGWTLWVNGPMTDLYGYERVG